jgi:hypothetical protein
VRSLFSHACGLTQRRAFVPLALQAESQLPLFKFYKNGARVAVRTVRIPACATNARHHADIALLLTMHRG